MARPSLPTLTWSHTAVISQTNCTAQQCLEHIQTLLGTTAHWENKGNDSSSLNQGGEAHIWITAGPKSGSATQSQRVTIGFRGTSAFTAGSMGVYDQSSPGQRMGAGNIGANRLAFNYQPEGGEVGFGSGDQLEPYNNGGSRRSLGWYPATEDQFNTTKTINIWLIESEEILVVCIEDASSTNEDQYGFQCGPMWVGATDQAGDVDALSRIWGFSAWPRPWKADFARYGGVHYQGVWSSEHDGGSYNVHRNYCFDPANPTLGLSLGAHPVPSINDYGQDHDAGADDCFISQTGAYTGWDVQFSAFKGLGHTLSDPKYLGVWRQIRRGATVGSGRHDVSSGGTLRAIVRCGSGNKPGFDSLWYTNS